MIGVTGEIVSKQSDRGRSNDDDNETFERMVYIQLYEYFSSNNILSKYQSGFRPLHSTTTALLDATTEWLLNMDMKN